MAIYLLDTNVLSSIIKKSAEGQAQWEKLRRLLRENALLIISPVVYYEIARGLYKVQAETKVAFLEKLISLLEWRDFSRTTWDKGAKLWAKCRRSGTITGEGIDKDILIAAQALEHGATVITNNIRHFEYLGVDYETW